MVLVSEDLLGVLGYAVSEFLEGEVEAGFAIAAPVIGAATSGAVGQEGLRIGEVSGSGLEKGFGCGVELLGVCVEEEVGKRGLRERVRPRLRRAIEEGFGLSDGFR